MRTVLTAALGQMLVTPPLSQVHLDEPVHELADLLFDFLRRVGDDLLLEALLDPASIEQIHNAPDPHRFIEVIVAAALHLQEDAVDVGHPQVEIP